MGVDVVCVPDMRAAKSMLPQVNQARSFGQLKRQTVAVVKVFIVH